MRLNDHEENVHGQGECSSPRTPTPAPVAAAATAGATDEKPAAAPQPRKACRHHVDESLGGAHH